MNGLIIRFAYITLVANQLLFHVSTLPAQVFSKGAPAAVTLESSISLSDGIITVGPDPTHTSELLGILEDTQVQAALALSASQLSGIAKVRKELQGALNKLQSLTIGSAEFHAEYKKAKTAYAEAASLAVDELLEPEQLVRLKQIVYRMEISILGYDGSLIHGRLGLAAGIYEGQVAHLAKRTQEIMAEAETKINAIREEAETRILEELTAEQRKKTREFIGPFFEYKYKSPLTKVASEMRLRREASREQSVGK